MKPKTNDRAKAEDLYIHGDMTLRDLAVQTGLSYGTLTTWSKKSNWRQQRAQLRQEPSSAIEILKRKRERLIVQFDFADEKNAPALLEMVYKCSRVIENMEENVCGPDAILAVMDRFTGLVAAEADDQACSVIRTWVEKFFEKVQAGDN